jgi:ferritin-like metal-binding protein YciE
MKLHEHGIQNFTDSDRIPGNKNFSWLMRLFENELNDIYWVEKAIKKAIPRMSDHATTVELIEVLDHHHAQTKMHIMRIERIFEILNMEATAEKGRAMESMIRETDEIMKQFEKGPLRDAGIISAAQKIDHYEIAAYGTLCQFAETLDIQEAERLLGQTLTEEKASDNELNIVALYEVNVLADQ